MKLPDVSIKKILYATDLSDSARQAYAYAVSLANLYGAGMILVHVLPEVPELLDTNVVGYISKESWEKIKTQHFQEAREALIGKRRDHQAIKDVLQQFCAEARGQNLDTVTDEVIVERGNPAEHILQIANEKQVDLVVMGSHGYGTFKDAMMGGTARRVLRYAKIPVLLVRLPEE